MSQAHTPALPTTHKAAVIHKLGQPLTVENLPTPTAVHGTVVIRVHSAPVYGPWRALLFSGQRPPPFFSHPEPYTPNRLTVGRIAAVGPDTTSLNVGQLVVTDYHVRARDDPINVQYLGSATTFGRPQANKHAEVYRHGGWAEYMLVAHENCHAIDEARFLGAVADGGLGWSVEQLAYLPWLAIPYAGLRDIELKAGDSIAVIPATGVFGGAAVEVASAMGARVIACGRNVEALERLASRLPNVKTVRLSGDVETDVAAITAHHGPVDCFQDLSTPTMANLDHVKAGVGALAVYGRASIMGGSGLDAPINYGAVVHKSLTIKGRFMYADNSVKDLIKLAAAGRIKPGNLNASRTFGLEQWEEALYAAEKYHAWGNLVSITP